MGWPKPDLKGIRESLYGSQVNVAIVADEESCSWITVYDEGDGQYHTLCSVNEANKRDEFCACT